MQRLEVSGAVRLIYGSLGGKRLNISTVQRAESSHCQFATQKHKAHSTVTACVLCGGDTHAEGVREQGAEENIWV